MLISSDLLTFTTYRLDRRSGVTLYYVYFSLLIRRARMVSWPRVRDGAIVQHRCTSIRVSPALYGHHGLRPRFVGELNCVDKLAEPDPIIGVTRNIFQGGHDFQPQTSFRIFLRQR